MAQTVKRLPAMQETRVRSPGREDSPGEGNGNPLQYSCLGNPMNRGAWWATFHGVTKESDTTERLHFHFTIVYFLHVQFDYLFFKKEGEVPLKAMLNM